jgi:hypothetical protein
MRGEALSEMGSPVFIKRAGWSLYDRVPPTTERRYLFVEGFRRILGSQGVCSSATKEILSSENSEIPSRVLMTRLSYLKTI